jgi:hypothetical protein
VKVWALKDPTDALSGADDGAGVSLQTVQILEGHHLGICGVAANPVNPASTLVGVWAMRVLCNPYAAGATRYLALLFLLVLRLLLPLSHLLPTTTTTIPSSIQHSTLPPPLFPLPYYTVVVSASLDNTIHVWDIENARAVKSIDAGPGAAVRAIVCTRPTVISLSGSIDCVLP